MAVESHRIAVIPGDGIGPEVVGSALEVLATVSKGGPEFETKEFDLGARRYFATGEIFTESDQEELKQYDAILLGAIGDPRVPSGILERGLLLKLRFAFDHYINLRPAKLYPGAVSPLINPGEIDFIVVREGTEGLYCGNGGSVRTGTREEIATEVSVNTAYGVERTVRYAFQLAASRKRKKVTLVHKHNVLVNAGHLWRRWVEEVAGEYPEVEWDYCHIDAATIYLVTDPSRFDVIVTDNLFGDILTDEAGAITGGIGLAASGNINPDRVFPSMFEPVHGSAPDIAGQGIADPRATIISLAMMLRFLGHEDLAQRVEKAVEADLAVGAAANDEGGQGRGPRTTKEITAAVIARLSKD